MKDQEKHSMDYLLIGFILLYIGAHLFSYSVGA